MSKKMITKKSLNNRHVVAVPYCRLQFALNTVEPFAYSAGTYGWSCDYYELPRGIVVSTGYRAIGEHVPYDLLEEYDERARRICEDTRDYGTRCRVLGHLLADLAGDLERVCFS